MPPGLGRTRLCTAVLSGAVVGATLTGSAEAHYPAIDLARLRAVWPRTAKLEPAIAAQLEVDARYASYVDRQEADIVAFRKEESVRIPTDFPYASIAGLSAEVRQKLEALRPATLAQAGRMEGMTPAALMLLLAHLRKAPARVIPEVAQRLSGT